MYRRGYLPSILSSVIRFSECSNHSFSVYLTQVACSIKYDLTIDKRLLTSGVKDGLIAFNGKLSLMQCRKFKIQGLESGCLYPVVLIWDTP